MNETAIIDDRRWYVVHTKPRQEERAYNNLREWNIEAFFPKINEHHLNPYTGSPTYVSKGLFPRYIFARFNSDRLLHKVRFTRGVHSVLGIGGIPTSVQDELVTLIQLRVDQHGFVKIDSDLSSGDKVVIKNGPLTGLMGIFKPETGEDKRVIILLESVSYQARILVERSTVQKYSGH